MYKVIKRKSDISSIEYLAKRCERYAEEFNWYIIDASETIEEIHKKLYNIIKTL